MEIMESMPIVSIPSKRDYLFLQWGCFLSGRGLNSKVSIPSKRDYLFLLRRVVSLQSIRGGARRDVSIPSKRDYLFLPKVRIALKRACYAGFNPV